MNDLETKLKLARAKQKQARHKAQEMPFRSYRNRGYYILSNPYPKPDLIILAP